MHLVRVVAFGVLVAGLAACSSTTSGKGHASAPPAVATAASSSPTGPISVQESPSAVSSVSAPSASTETVVVGPPAAHIDTFEATSYQDHCVQDTTAPPMPKLVWKVSNATGVAISVDDPSGVGSYGTYPVTAGSQDMPLIGCTGARGSTITHRYDLYTVGGAGAPAHQTITVTITID